MTATAAIFLLTTFMFFPYSLNITRKNSSNSPVTASPT